METKAQQIERGDSAAARGLTLERYVATMMPRWGSNSVKRWTRHGHYALEREDLLSEAALVLTEVWYKYSDLKPEGELRRMGTGAIFKHVSNVFYHHMPWTTKRSQARGRVAPQMVSADRGPDGDYAVSPIDLHAVDRSGRIEPQLESLIARESAETLPVAGFRGSSADAVRRIFSDVACALKTDDGYLLMEAAERLNYNQQGEIRMNGGATVAAGPEGPDVNLPETFGTMEEEVHDVPKAPKAEKTPKAPKAPKAPRVKRASPARDSSLVTMAVRGPASLHQRVVSRAKKDGIPLGQAILRGLALYLG